jgi:hypothetical protein
MDTNRRVLRDWFYLSGGIAIGSKEIGRGLFVFAFGLLAMTLYIGAKLLLEKPVSASPDNPETKNG